MPITARDDVLIWLTATADDLALDSAVPRLGPESPLVGVDAVIDSVTLVELLSRVDDRFGVEIRAADVALKRFSTLGTLADVIVSRSSGATGPG